MPYVTPEELRQITDIHDVMLYMDHRGYMPGIRLNDGTFMSVQCGRRAASRWRYGTYISMEVGYPTKVIDEFLPYARNPRKPTDTVYRYVPVEIINEVIHNRGGIAALRAMP